MLQPQLNGIDKRGDTEDHSQKNGQKKENAAFEMFEQIGDGADQFFVNAEDRRNRTARKSGDDKCDPDRRAAHDVCQKANQFILSRPVLRGDIFRLL